MAGHQLSSYLNVGIALKSHLSFTAPGGIGGDLCCNGISAQLLFLPSPAAPIPSWLFFFVRMLPNKHPALRSAPVTLFLRAPNLRQLVPRVD